LFFLVKPQTLSAQKVERADLGTGGVLDKQG
jgi:hypothetical protein